MDPVSDQIDFIAVDHNGTYAVRIRNFRIVMLEQSRDYPHVPEGQSVIRVIYENGAGVDCFYALGLTTDFTL
jgi:hypothetical protein